MPRVSPEYAEGLYCPKLTRMRDPSSACGRPLRWIGAWSKDGTTFKRDTWEYRSRERIAAEDRETREVVSTRSREATTERRYVHACTLRCTCGWCGTPSMALHKPALAPGEGPAGYWIDA